jgi:hypothetical protein
MEALALNFPPSRIHSPFSCEAQQKSSNRACTDEEVEKVRCFRRMLTNVSNATRIEWNVECVRM